MILLINPFIVNIDDEVEFLELWDQTNEIFAAAAGYINARLVKAIDNQVSGQSTLYTHINIAEWAT